MVIWNLEKSLAISERLCTEKVLLLVIKALSNENIFIIIKHMRICFT